MPQILNRMKRHSFLGDRLGGRVNALLRKQKPVVGAERTSGWYDKKFAVTQAYHVPYQDSPYYFVWSVIVDRLRRDGLKKVLEIGCGTGQLAAFLLHQGIETYTGIDFSPKAIAYARQAAPSGRFIVDDAQTSSIYTEEQHDVLICTEVLEHIADDLSVVRRFRPGTRCLFSVPSYDSEGHVRFFSDAAAVKERYENYFSTLDIAEFRTAGSTLNTIFLVDGGRNHFESRL
jgi:2-polyprenyl-3-methyl-5-hydroxy-6-metoxy-1,4-benzoquinol methylase